MFGDAERTYQRGDLAKAQVEADAGYRQFLTSDPAWAGRFRVLEIQMMLLRGLYKPALTALESAPSSILSDCELLVRKHLVEAAVYLRLGRDSDVDSKMREAAIGCPNQDPKLLVDITLQRGEVIDDPPEAELDYKKALSIARENRDLFRQARALLDLSNIAQIQEHYGESIDWGKASLEISSKMGYRRFDEITKGNLGWNYYKLGDFDQALNLFSEAEQEARQLDAGYQQVRWENNLGLTHEQTGELDRAANDYRQALALAQQQGDRNQTTIALEELAFLSIRTGNLQEAEKYDQQALDLSRQADSRPLELAALMAQALIAEHEGDLSKAESLLSQVSRDPGHDRQSLRWQAQTELANLYATERQTAKADAAYRAALATVKQARCGVQQEELRLPFLANATSVYDAYVKFLVAENKPEQALGVADESRAMTLAEGLETHGQKCLDAQSSISSGKLARQADAVVLFYWLGQQQSILWAVTPAETSVFYLPPSPRIQAEIATYRRALNGPRDPIEAGNADGAWLYSTLVSPAASAIAPGKKVIVVADGALSGLNFETLIVPEPKAHYWIEDVTIENASSLRLLAAAARRRPDAQHRLLLIGDSSALGSEFNRLPNAGAEMTKIEAHFPPEQEMVFAKQLATADKYLGSHPDQFSFIHFVAHGTASQTSPLDSAVVLSPSPGDGNFKLYAREIIQHPLNADLVTVSTCYGAGARAYVGEGMVGLSWAFLRAGAHHVIGALWEVSDSSTPLLMDRMYDQLSAGRPPEQALRDAKLSLLHSDTAYRKPYYWAPFQLYTGS